MHVANHKGIVRSPRGDNLVVPKEERKLERFLTRSPRGDNMVKGRDEKGLEAREDLLRSLKFQASS